MILVMQRLHEGDLAGHLLERGSWKLLSLPAIATQDAQIPLLFGKFHTRRVGDVLHPEHMPLVELQRMQAEMGEFAWNSQYQQEPVSQNGNLVKRDHIIYYEPAQLPAEGHIVQSWDTASRDGIFNDYSVCVTGLVYNQRLYIIDVYRRKMEFPELLRQVEAQAKLHGARTLIIEEKASGLELISMLRNKPRPGVPLPLGRVPKSDKISRMAAGVSRIESGQVLLPKSAAWLSTFVEELVAFPGKHDDQVDALSQLLDWLGGYLRNSSHVEYEGAYIPTPDPEDQDYEDLDEDEEFPC